MEPTSDERWTIGKTKAVIRNKLIAERVWVNWHLMSVLVGEDVNLALADAVDLADALASEEVWPASTLFEEVMTARAMPAAQDAAYGLNSDFSSHGIRSVLAHDRDDVGEVT
jgi:hypothetical protein